MKAIPKIDTTPEPRPSAPAVAHAMKILDYLAHDVSEAGVSEIARALNINKSTCFNILATLARYQAVAKHPRYAVYRAGPKLIELGRAARRSLAEGSDLHERVTRLVAEVGLTCVIGQALADDSGVVIVDRVVPHLPDVRVLPVGRVVPLTTPAIGRAVLASRDESDAIELARRLGIFTPGDEAEFARQLDSVREAGYGSSLGAFVDRVNAVAAVAGGSPGTEVVVCVVGYREHFPNSALHKVARRMIETIGESQALERAVPRDSPPFPTWHAVDQSSRRRVGSK